MAAEITIIIPVFNGAQTLEKTIASVIGGTQFDLNLIIIDDASTDDTPTIIDRILFTQNKPQIGSSNVSIRIITHGSNKGLSTARNSGLDATQTQFVGFWDADDLMEPLALDRFGNCLKNTSADLVRGFMVRNMDGQRWITPRAQALGSRQEIVTLAEKPELTLDFSCCSGLYKTDFLKNNGLRFIDGLYMQDLVFTTQALAAASTIAVFPYSIGDYVQSITSASRSNASIRFNSLFDIHDHLEQICNNNKYSEAFRNHLMGCFIHSAVNNFVKYVLENNRAAPFPENTDIDRLSNLLKQLGSGAIEAYCRQARDPASFLKLNQLRLGQIEAARETHLAGSNPQKPDTLLKALENFADEEDLKEASKTYDELVSMSKAPDRPRRINLHDQEPAPIGNPILFNFLRRLRDRFRF